MKLVTKIIFLSLCVFSLPAELLVIKKTSTGFAPLNAFDIDNYEEIANVLLNYQWPMVIANNSLTEQEKEELLTADQLYAEEDFIRKKLQKINPDYDVVFIPTSLFELFLIVEKHSESNEAKEVSYVNVIRFLTKPLFNFFADSPLDIAVKKFHKFPRVEVHVEKKYQLYTQANNIFYPAAFLYSNNLLAHALFNQYPMLQNSSSIREVSAIIEAQSYNFAAWLLHKRVDLLNYRLFASMTKESNIVKGNNDLDVVHELSSMSINRNKVLAQTISLEYQARSENRALLLRGSKLFDLVTSLASGDRAPERMELMGSALSTHHIVPNRNEDKYLMSLSFGNSLFAGYVNDSDACAYIYLSHYNGYGLFINKKDYIEHQSSQLFFISPLSSITALYAHGEMFHSRSKAGTYRPLNDWGLTGLACAHYESCNKDALVVHRDPLFHAQLFSDYLADNMHIIINEKTGVSDLTPEEQAVYDQKILKLSDQLKSNQRKAAQYYAATRVLNHFISKIKLNEKI